MKLRESAGIDKVSSVSNLKVMNIQDADAAMHTAYRLLASTHLFLQKPLTKKRYRKVLNTQELKTEFNKAGNLLKSISNKLGDAAQDWEDEQEAFDARGDDDGGQANSRNV